MNADARQDEGLLVAGLRRLVRAALGPLPSELESGTPADVPTLEQLRHLAPEAFEAWVGSCFRQRGQVVEHTGTMGRGDHGVDLVVCGAGERAVVQCKKYGDWTVGEPTLRDLFGAMHHHRAGRAYLVTTGRVSQAAWRWAVGKPIDIWDAARLVELGLARKEPAPGSGASAPGSTGVEHHASGPAVDCPRCGVALVLRVARKGKHEGTTFLGCPNFPGCRVTRPIDRRA